MPPRRPDVLGHLTRDVLDSTVADIEFALAHHEREDKGGFFSIPALCFSVIDYLGALYKGPKSQVNSRTKAILVRYMGQVDPRYVEYADMLYAIWRNGIVHERTPKVLRMVVRGKPIRFGWWANNSSETVNRRQHLTCVRKQSNPALYLLGINLFELVDDLKAAIKLFADDLDNDRTKKKIASKHYRELRKAKAINALPGAKEMKQRIRASVLCSSAVSF